MPTWLPVGLAALVVWSIQRAISKAVLERLTTPQFYLLSAVVSLPVYLPMLVFDPPPPGAIPGALALSALMAVTFGVTTEAIRRGPVGRVSPITGLSPALTSFLAFVLLHEQPSAFRILGIVLAVVAVALLGYKHRSSREPSDYGWLALAVGSLLLQGVGAFLAKVVVTPSGPSALLVTSAAVQVVVGSALLRRAGEPFPRPHGRLMRWTVLVLVLAAVATIGYLWALSKGPASVIVPLVATSPALGGLIGALALHERPTSWQYAGIMLGVGAAVLLAAQA